MLHRLCFVIEKGGERIGIQNQARSQLDLFKFLVDEFLNAHRSLWEWASSPALVTTKVSPARRLS